MNYILFEIAIKWNEIIEITIFMWIELMDMAIIGISFQHCISFSTDSELFLLICTNSFQFGYFSYLNFSKMHF